MIKTRPMRAQPRIPLPAALSETVANYDWALNRIGESGGTVFRLRGTAEVPDLFLKYGTGDIAGEVTDEMARLLWLRTHVAVPAIVHFVRTAGEAWLVTTALQGQPAYGVLEADVEARPAIVDALASFLRRLHAIPVNECRFHSGASVRLAQARRRIDAGLVDVEDFDEERKGWTAEDVWTAIERLGPLAEDRVVTHGDFSLDNILIHNGAVTGCIDVGRAGIADRYQDLAILWNCLGEFGAGLPDRFLRTYGITDPDTRRLNFHLLLDELF